MNFDPEFHVWLLSLLSIGHFIIFYVYFQFPINIKLDNTDRKILEILQLNAKITNAQLAKDISLSPAPTLERVKKLENSGIIRSYHASLDKEKIGLGVVFSRLQKML
mgnify:CR=1 FL=1